MLSYSQSFSSRGGVEQVQHAEKFEQMAAIQEELSQICNRLNLLRSIDAGAASTFSTLNVGKSIDPAVAHMLSVELCQLAAAGDKVGVRILLNCGADVDCKDYDERTPLHLASALGHVQMVKLLLDHGADFTLSDKDGKTPLDLAKMNGCGDIEELLIQHSEACHKKELSGGCRSFSIDTSFEPVHVDLSQIPQPMVGSLVVVMVGLPGRGCSYIARQIQRYFQWNGLHSKIFIDADYRKEEDDYECSEPFTSFAACLAENEYNVANLIAKDVAEFISQADSVAVLDGTNGTAARRLALMNAIKETACIRPNRVVFVELINNDPDVVRKNVDQLKEMLSDASDGFVDDYYAKIKKEEARYESLDPLKDECLTYIRIEECTTFSLNNVFGWMPSRLVYMLHNLSHTPGELYLSRSGEYVDLVAEIIGGNSGLTERGEAYSEALFEYFQKELGEKSFIVMSSSALRCTETVQYFDNQRTIERNLEAQSEGEDRPQQLNCSVGYFPTLNHVDAGVCDGLRISDVCKTMPGILQQILEDPYYTEWPNGECVHQVYNTRLEPHIHEIQASTEPILVVSHLQLLQGIYSYFVSENNEFVAPQDAYKIHIPFESVIKIRLVGINRLAEVIDLSKEVDRIQLKRYGKVTKRKKSDISEIFGRYSRK